jgi:hypothetical protein
MQMNTVNLVVDVETLMLCTVVISAHIANEGCSSVTLHTLALYLASLAAVGVSRLFQLVLGQVDRRKVVLLRSSFAAVIATLIRRAVSAADGGNHRETGDTWVEVVVGAEGSIVATGGELRSGPAGSPEETSRKFLGAAHRTETQTRPTLVGIHISDPAVHNWCIAHQVNFGTQSTGSVASVSRFS